MDKREESQEKRIRGFCTSLKWKVLWRKKDCGMLLEKRDPEGKGRVAKGRG